jgi:hypothetical protein
MLLLNISTVTQLNVSNLMTLFICHILDFCTVNSLADEQIPVLFVVQRGYLHQVYRGTIFCLMRLWLDNFLLTVYRQLDVRHEQLDTQSKTSLATTGVVKVCERPCTLYPMLEYRGH